MKNLKLVFEKQVWHYLFLAILLAIALSVIRLDERFLLGEFLGIDTPVWFYLALGIPVFHTLYVWFCWRTQLHYSLLSQWFGDKAFGYYSALFYLLLASRLIAITFLAISSPGTLNINRTVLTILTVAIAIPAAYLLYSVLRYFGVKRAAGADHFDSAYRGKQLVREGIFKYTGNAMYVFGLLVLWMPGLLAASAPALLTAFFSHLYIWVHYYTTELPDMRRFYNL
jgi:hypothetical protein